MPEVWTGWTGELRDWLDGAAREAGFDAVGVAAAGGPDDAESAQDAERYAAWVDAGRAGEMEYLKRRDESGALLRGGLRVAMPWARSVVVCALNYNSRADGIEPPRSIDAAPAGAGWIARYAWSGRRLAEGDLTPTDYHKELLGRLRRIEAGLVARVGCQTRCYVDTGPVLERSYAARAGVGWIGKNTCVINQRLGSWLLLGVMVTSLEVKSEGTGDAAEVAGGMPVSLSAPDRCGSCTRCIDACPTGALLGSSEVGGAREMDASRCIAYLTIEKKGAIGSAPGEDLREKMGRQVFGCDICQEVCPWNRRAPVGNHEGMEARKELINPALEWLAGMDAKEFQRRFKGSPLERTGHKRLMRNVAIAMGNSGQARFIETLDQWRAGADPTLADAAAWAAERLAKTK